MTERKPHGVDFESWVDKQIREAQQRGEFSDLPGFGKPLAGVSRPYDEDWWIKEKMRREHVSFLPPALALRKAAEDALAEALAARSESEARRVIEDINKEIGAALKMPPPGPPLLLGRFDVEEVVATWRQNRRHDGDGAGPGADLAPGPAGR
ncbi:DUF1992 domain-containing protein [Streptomyces triculaminicus]|uniref:DUF1992 domain-containing protein n=2 Tax=Streptomyces TaxID=1883 RepID=A0A939FWK4_9ACTN|nr:MULTISPECIES: DUF1992 domain-containing protein [Streptomyces]MBO0657400.1 DUF1992 domain-containing protein [Streptomyces triculaminicus]QSY49399.1 DUF1992 domain-containing protein [Streptomyces griseocarneus]